MSSKKKIIPYDYQETARKNTVSYVRLDKGLNPMLLPVVAGGGKTMIAGLIAEDLRIKFPKMKVAFISPLKTITTQTRDTFPNCGIYQSGDAKRPTHGSNVTLYTMQTFINKFIKLSKKAEKKGYSLSKMPFGFIFIDEIQMLQKPVKKILQVIEEQKLNVNILFMSATPYTADKVILETCKSAKLVLGWEYANSEKYIRDGRLLPLSLKQLGKAPIKEEDLARADDGEFTKGSHDKVAELVTDEVKSISPFIPIDKKEVKMGQQTIVLASNIKHVDKITADLIAAGYTARAMHSNVKKNKEVLEAFKRGEFQVIVAIRMITVGTNIPNAINLVIACMIGSIATLIQACARCQRIGDEGSGSIARVFDLLGNFERLGMPTQKIVPLAWDSKSTKKKGKCPHCESKKFVVQTLDTYIEDNTKFRHVRYSCCKQEDIVGQELPTVACESCNEVYLMSEAGTERIKNEVFSVCPNCGDFKLIEVLQPKELITAVEDLNDFALQLFGVFKKDLDYAKQEKLYKMLQVFAAFNTPERIIEVLDTAIGATGEENPLIIEDVIRESRSLISRFRDVVRLFSRKGFDLNLFNPIGQELIINEGKLNDYNNRLSHRLSKLYNIGNANDIIDMTNLGKQLRTHASYCAKIDKGWIPPKFNEKTKKWERV
jgi:superfamily II DNA or RNA helicase